MRKYWVFAVLALFTSSCGDGDEDVTSLSPTDLRSPTDLQSSRDVPSSTALPSPTGSSAVGGAQVSRSSSFMLVTNVSTSPQHTSSNGTVTLKSGLAAQ